MPSQQFPMTAPPLPMMVAMMQWAAAWESHQQTQMAEAQAADKAAAEQRAAKEQEERAAKEAADRHVLHLKANRMVFQSCRGMCNACQQADPEHFSCACEIYDNFFRKCNTDAAELDECLLVNCGAGDHTPLCNRNCVCKMVVRRSNGVCNS